MPAPRPILPCSAETAQRLAVALGAFAVAFTLCAARVGHGAPDFYVFWTAAQHWRTPYDPAIIGQLEAAIRLKGVWPFAYPPTFLLFVWPFTQLPMTLAYPLWTGLGAAAFFYAASHEVRPPWASAILALSPVVFFSAELGQTTLLIGAAVVGGWRLRETRPALAGVLFAIAACIKPQAMILAPVVLWGRWRMLGAMLGAGAGLCAASLVFGLQRWIEWPHALAAFHAIASQTDRANPSALLASPWWAALMAAFGLYLAVSRRDLVGLVGGAMCLTPYAHAYDLAPLAPVAASWLFDRRRFGWPRTFAGAALLAGIVATPASVLMFFAGLAAIGRRWRVGPPLAPNPAADATPALGR